MRGTGRQDEHVSVDSADSLEKSGLRNKFRGLLGRKGAQSKPEATVVVLPAKRRTESPSSGLGNNTVALPDASPPLPSASPAVQTSTARTPTGPATPPPPPQTAKLPKSSSPVAQAAEVSLWDQAYDKLGQKNPSLVKDYEELLQKESEASGELHVFC